MGSVRLLRLYDVKDHTGLSKSEIYRLMAEDRFPKAIPLGKRSVAWRSDEVDAWVAERIHNAEVAKATPSAMASTIDVHGLRKGASASVEISTGDRRSSEKSLN